MTAAILADFKTEPYLHQLREFETSADMPARALLWQMRTGKTKVVIDTACHLYKEDSIDTVVVVAPNGVHENWIRRELPIHHWDSVDCRTVTWRTSIAGETPLSSNSMSNIAKEKWRHEYEDWWMNTKAALKDKKTLSWFAFNSESMTRHDVRLLIARVIRNRRVLIVFDESQDYRKAGSKRTKMARAAAHKCAYRRILTGTPVTNSPLHAFSQYELLEKKALGFGRFEDFKNRFAEYEMARTRQGRKYPRLVDYRNLDELQMLMAPWSSVILRSDCNDLPLLVPRTRHIDLTDQQQRLYRELHDQFVLDVAGQEVNIGENTNRFMKLQQVVSGFLVDEFKEVHTIPGPNPRLEALSDEVYLCPGKAIVWCRFREDMDRVASRLRADGHRVVEYHGRVSDEDKATARELMAPGADNDVKALVGYPTAGLDLSAAAEVIWYSHVFDAIKREQADERATAMYGDNIPVIDLVAPGIDGYILDRVAENISIAEALAGRGMQEALKRIDI